MMIYIRLTVCSILLHSLFQTTLATTVTTDNDIFFNSYLKSEKALILLQDVSSTTTNKLHTLREIFLSWKKDHNVSYETLEEELSRMLTWTQNHEFITEHNSKKPKPSFTLGHNSFSDKSNDEFQRMNALGKYSLGKDFFFQSVQEIKKRNEFMPQFEREDLFSIQKELRHLRDLSEKQGMKRSDVDYFDDLFDDDFVPAQDDHAATDDGNMDDDDTGDLPDEIDWVEAGAVTPVKNQGRCGSCWAFSSTGAIEGAHFIATGELVALSEQNIMDCDKIDHSCEGGLMENAFQFEESQKGLCSENDYPYLAMDESICMTNCTKVSGTHVTGYTDLSPGDKHSLIASIVTQPTSIAMDAGNLSFQFYSGGVFDDDSCGADGSIDHGVLAVGYGFDEASGHKFFKIKNSWGESWGDGGFFKIKRDSKNEFGTCAILAYMTAPVVS